MEVPAMRSAWMPISSSARITPMCAHPRAEPPPRAKPMRGMGLSIGSPVGARERVAVPVSCALVVAMLRSPLSYPLRTGKGGKDDCEAAPGARRVPEDVPAPARSHGPLGARNRAIRAPRRRPASGDPWPPGPVDAIQRDRRPSRDTRAGAEAPSPYPAAEVPQGPCTTCATSPTGGDMTNESGQQPTRQQPDHDVYRTLVESTKAIPW